MMSRPAILLFLALASLYVVSQFLRNATGVILPEISAELALSGATLSWLPAAFFFGFTLMQIPVGIGIDRFGPRRVLLVCGGLVIAGTLLFAIGQRASSLVGARVLMGIGCSSFLMAPLAIYARWFAKDRFSRIAGWHFGFGNIGAVLATAPLGFLSVHVGWRIPFVGAAILIACVCVLAAFAVHDHRPGQTPMPRAPTSLWNDVRGLGAVVRVRSFWPVFVMHMSAYPTLAVVQSFWGGLFLRDIYGLGPDARSWPLLTLVLGQIIGVMLFWGGADRVLGSYKKPVIVGSTVAFGCLLVLAGAPVMPYGALLGLLFVYGFANSHVIVAIAHGRALFPEHLLGRGLTTMNMGNMGGVVLMQVVTGALAGLIEPDVGEGTRYTVGTYQAIFLCLAVAYGLALAYYWCCACEPYRDAPEPASGSTERPSG